MKQSERQLMAARARKVHEDGIAAAERRILATRMGLTPEADGSVEHEAHQSTFRPMTAEAAKRQLAAKKGR